MSIITLKKKKSFFIFHIDRIFLLLLLLNNFTFTWAISLPKGHQSFFFDQKNPSIVVICSTSSERLFSYSLVQFDMYTYTITFSFFFSFLRSNHNRQDFWNGTLVDDYNFLMSEELIYHCKVSRIKKDLNKH